MAKGEVILTAQKVKKRKKSEKVVMITLLVLLLFLILSYFILNIIYNEGSFTISMDKNAKLESNLILYESLNDRSPIYKIQTKRVEFMDNISVKWLPEDINKEAEGAHNGDNYIAHSFYLENVGEETINYRYSITIDDIIKNVDDAVRIMIYINDDKMIYAKKSALTNKAEPDTVAFKDGDDVISEKRASFNPGDIDKVTVVVWLEGDDPECVNAILGGELKMHMDIYEEHIEEKLN